MGGLNIYIYIYIYISKETIRDLIEINKAARAICENKIYVFLSLLNFYTSFSESIAESLDLNQNKVKIHCNNIFNLMWDYLYALKFLLIII